MKKSIFAGKTLMITGGTGSFGNAVLNRFLKTDIGEIRVFSRDLQNRECYNLMVVYSISRSIGKYSYTKQ